VGSVPFGVVVVCVHRAPLAEEPVVFALAALDALVVVEQLRSFLSAQVVGAPVVPEPQQKGSTMKAGLLHAAYVRGYDWSKARYANALFGVTWSHARYGVPTTLPSASSTSSTPTLTSFSHYHNEYDVFQVHAAIFNIQSDSSYRNGPAYVR